MALETTVPPSPDPLVASTPVGPALDHDPPGEPAAGASRLSRFRRPWVIVAAVVVALVIGFGVWWFFFRSTGQASVATSTGQIATVTRGDMKTTVSGNGTVAAADTDNLSFTSSGKVTAVNVKAGDTVKAGQVLATIDSSELQSSLSSAEANLASAQATLADAESAGSSSQQIAADKASVTSAQDSVTSAQQALSGASLVATFDGTVSQVDLTVGESLGSSGTGATTPTGSATGSGLSSSALGSSTSPTGGTGNSSTTSSAQITVVSAGRYTVQLSIGTSDIDKVAVGQSAQLTVTTSGSSATSGLPSFLAGPAEASPASAEARARPDRTSPAVARAPRPGRPRPERSPT